MQVEPIKPITDVREAVRVVDTYEGDPRSLRLPIHDVLQDPMGLNMALVLDRVLARGWWPDGYEQENGFRIYKYKDANQKLVGAQASIVEQLAMPGAEDVEFDPPRLGRA